MGKTGKKADFQQTYAKQTKNSLQQTSAKQ